MWVDVDVDLQQMKVILPYAKHTLSFLDQIQKKKDLREEYDCGMATRLPVPEIPATSFALT